jgi:hypothetical protein
MQDGITALLRATGELGGLVKMEKRSSKLEGEKDSTGFIWLSPSPCPTVPCTSPTCPRVGALVLVEEGHAAVSTELKA